MGQQEIFNLLKRHKKLWFSSKEIARVIGATVSTTTIGLKKMRKQNILHYKTKVSDKGLEYFIYKYKEYNED